MKSCLKTNSWSVFGCPLIFILLFVSSAQYFSFLPFLFFDWTKLFFSPKKNNIHREKKELIWLICCMQLATIDDKWRSVQVMHDDRQSAERQRIKLGQCLFERQSIYFSYSLSLSSFSSFWERKRTARSWAHIYIAAHCFQIDRKSSSERVLFFL